MILQYNIKLEFSKIITLHNLNHIRYNNDIKQEEFLVVFEHHTEQSHPVACRSGTQAVLASSNLYNKLFDLKIMIHTRDY